MYRNKPLVCPACGSDSIILKHEATYVYSYVINPRSGVPGSKNETEFLPFLYDSREQKGTYQYLECRRCGTSYPCYFNRWDGKAGPGLLSGANMPDGE